ncbi:branched chain amino acid ABC transporter permease [Burkholderia pseudomallei]|nr:branched chain amino acid ABC transporter permease [Burkholderia pseudomallei]
MDIFGIPVSAMLSQLLLGLVNGSFYAILSLGLAVIFGLLNVINFAHGALFMLGAMLAWMGLNYLGLPYWAMLVLAPVVVGLFGILIERSMLRWLYKLDHLYGLLLTFGLTLVVEGVFRAIYGSSGQPYDVPALLEGATNVGFMFLPNYRAWVVVASLAVCLATWFVIEKTRLGAYLRAGTENPKLVEAFGVNVPMMVTLTYGFGVALAAFAGVLAAPVIQVSPLMGQPMIITVFAVVVIGGMGSILGSIVTGLMLGVVEGLTRVFYPEASATVVFVIMAIVLLIRPAGLFGRFVRQGKMMQRKALYGLLLLGLLVAPFVGAYPVFVMKVLCFALFAAAFNLLIGFTGLLSFGHAMFLATAGYVTGYAMQSLGTAPELGVLAGTAAATLLGLVVGLFAIRRQGIYFAMITLAFAQMVYFIYLQAPFTHGEDGLQGVPRGRLFGLVDLSSDLALYYVVLVVIACACFFIVRIVHSPFGQVLVAIKENEPRAISLGYDTDRFKLLAFILSATLAGLAGALKVVVLGFETLSDAYWTMSGLVVLMTLVGGMGTLFGPLVGAALIVALEDRLGDIGGWLASVTHIDWFRSLGESATIVTGLIFIVCVLAFRRGIVGEVIARVRPLRAS